MADRASKWTSFAWAIPMREIEEDAPVSHDMIAYGLRSPEPVPKEVREYLAQVMEGQGKPRRSSVRNWFDREVTRDLVLLTHQICKASAIADPEPGKGQTRAFTALKRTQEMLAAHRLHMSMDAIRDVLLERKGWEKPV